MLPIYICEDDKIQLKIIKNFVQDYLIMHCIDNTYTIKTYCNPQDFLEEYKKTPQTGIYLLDCDFKGLTDGPELAQQIRTLDPIGYIIFISAQKKYIPLTLRAQVNIMDFILKDSIDFKQRLFTVLDAAFKIYSSYATQTNDVKNYYLINSGGKTIPVNYNDIIYVEVSHKPHKIILSATNMYIEFYGNLNKTSSELNSSDFFRCNRSALININHIAYINRSSRTIVMKNKKTFKFSTYCDIKKLNYKTN